MVLCRGVCIDVFPDGLVLSCRSGSEPSPEQQARIRAVLLDCTLSAEVRAQQIKAILLEK